MPTPRDYQIEDFQAVIASHAKHRRVIGRQPTGAGKGLLLAMLAEHYSMFGRVMILVDVKKLVRQLADTIHWVTGSRPGVEMGEESATNDSSFYAADRIVVSTVQTQFSGNPGCERYRKFPKHDFSLLLLDECEGFLAKKYREVVDWYLGNPRLNLCGVSASPMRTDGLAMANLFDHVAFNRDIVWGRDNGWLVRPRQAFVRVNVDFSTLKVIKDEEGDADYSDDEIASRLSNERTQIELAQGIVKVAENRKSIIVCPTIDVAKAVAHYIDAQKPGSARCIYGELAEQQKEDLFSGHQNGEFQFLSSVSMLCKGYDDPSVEAVFICRKTRSKRLYCLDSETEVLTDQGWMGINADHRSWGYWSPAVYDVNSGDIQWGRATAYVRRKVYATERMVCINTGQTHFRVTERHRMIWRRRYGQFGDRRTAWMMGPASEMCESAMSVEIPVAGIENVDPSRLTDDEIRFIGWFLTDGCHNKCNNAIAITQAKHQPWVKNIEDCIRGCGFKYGKHDVIRQNSFKDASPAWLFTISKGKPRGMDKHLAGWGRLETYIDKDFSRRLFELDRRQTAVLLEAIHQGDGSKQSARDWTQRSYHISTGNKTYCDRLQRLCVTRGFACNIATYRANGTSRKNDLFIIHIKDKVTRSVPTTARDRPTAVFEYPEIDERVWCVQTDAGTLVTRRRGIVSIVGNCQIAGRVVRPLRGIVDGLATAEQRIAAIAASAKPIALVVNMVGIDESVRDMTIVDILCEVDDAEVNARAKQLQLDEGLDAEEAIEQAEEEVEADREAERLLAEAEAAQLDDDEEQAIRRRFRVEAEVEVEYQDDLRLGGMRATAEVGVPQRQLQILRKAKLTDQEISRLRPEVAKKLAQKIVYRWKAGLSSYRQCRTLQKFGYSKQQLEGMSYDEASSTIDRIRTNGWHRLPQESVA